MEKEYSIQCDNNYILERNNDLRKVLLILNNKNPDTENQSV